MRLRTGYAGKSLHVPQQMSLYLTCICYGEIRARAGRKVFYRAKPAQKIQTRDPNTRGGGVKIRRMQAPAMISVVLCCWGTLHALELATAKQVRRARARHTSTAPEISAHFTGCLPSASPDR